MKMLTLMKPAIRTYLINIFIGAAIFSAQNVYADTADTCIDIGVNPQKNSSPNKLCVSIPTEAIEGNAPNLMGVEDSPVLVTLYKDSAKIKTLKFILHQKDAYSIHHGLTGETSHFPHSVNLEISEPGYGSNYGVSISFFPGGVRFEDFLFWSGSDDENNQILYYDRP